MKKLSFEIVAFFVVSILSLLLCSCGGGSSGTVVDYGDAEAFEEALNRGENLEDKTLMFTVTEIHPDSALGFNVCGGEHLNFISSRNPDLRVGDTAGVKATEITSILGSYAIKYEKIDNPIIGENTIVSSAQEGDASEEQKLDSTNDMPGGSSAVTEGETTVPEQSNTETSASVETSSEKVLSDDEDNDEAERILKGYGEHDEKENSTASQSKTENLKPLEIKESGYTVTGDSGDYYIHYGIVLYNPNPGYYYEYPNFRIIAEDSKGNVLDTDEQTLSYINGDRVSGYSGLACSLSEKPAKVTFEMVEDADNWCKGTSGDLGLEAVNITRTMDGNWGKIAGKINNTTDNNYPELFMDTNARPCPVSGA